FDNLSRLPRRNRLPFDQPPPLLPYELPHTFAIHTWAEDRYSVTCRLRYGLEPVVQRLDKVVENHPVGGFHRTHVERGHMEVVVAHVLEFAAVVTRDAHGLEGTGICPLNRFEDVWTVS